MTKGRGVKDSRRALSNSPEIASCLRMTRGKGVLIAVRLSMQSIEPFPEWSSGQAVRQDDKG
jgi:hypothetical protein